MRLDHLVIAVSDLAAPTGYESIEGGRHPGWGTANRIVPLGPVLDFDEPSDREKKWKQSA